MKTQPRSSLSKAVTLAQCCFQGCLGDDQLPGVLVDPTKGTLYAVVQLGVNLWELEGSGEPVPLQLRKLPSGYFGLEVGSVRCGAQPSFVSATPPSSF